MATIVADFIGGVMDGKTYAIPNCAEYHVAIAPEITPMSYIEHADDPSLIEFNVAVYRNIGHGIFWLSRIRKG